MLTLTGLGIATLGHVALSRPISLAAGIISLAVACISLFMARHAPPSRTWLILIGGWLLGYLAATALVIPVFYIFGNPPH